MTIFTSSFPAIYYCLVIPSGIAFALGIVADSPEAGELANLPRTMSGKPDGEAGTPK